MDHNLIETLEYNLHDIPVIPLTIDGTRLVGRMTVGNSHGLLIPAVITDSERQDLDIGMPEDVEVAVVKDDLNALGNCIVCNDSIALLHPNLTNETEEMVQRILGVETFRMTIQDTALVGTYAVISNKGGLVHPTIDLESLDEMSSILQIPLASGTVNKGCQAVSTGVIVNDDSGFVGGLFTPSEISTVDNIFGLNRIGDDEFVNGIRFDVLSSL